MPDKQPGSIEEVDVASNTDAPLTESESRALAAKILRRDYDPGWEIIRIRRNEPGLTYF